MLAARAPGLEIDAEGLEPLGPTAAPAPGAIVVAERERIELVAVWRAPDVAVLCDQHASAGALEVLRDPGLLATAVPDDQHVSRRR